MKVAETMVAAPRNSVRHRTKIHKDTMLDKGCCRLNECCKQNRSSVLIQQNAVKSDLICNALL